MMADKDVDASTLDKLFATPKPTEALSADDGSKDAFFLRVAEVAEAMIEKHGKDFAMGVLVLSARFIAEGKPLTKREGAARTKLS